MMTKENKKQIIQTAVERFGETTDLPKKELTAIAQEYGFSKVSYSWIKDFATGRGKYDLVGLARSMGVSVSAPVTPAASAVEHDGLSQRVMESTMDNIVPSKDPLFVKTNEYKIVEKVISSGVFYPVFITGMSGNGKSLSVVQAAANAKKELIRINVTAGTDEDDLIGSFRLVNGETVWQDGPIVEAMKRGALVLIDEIDMLNPNKAAALFTVLEGKGVYIKKTNAFIEPAPGFNVIATANTKGKGSDDGRFMGTNVLNEAFLERFPITLEYEYPGKTHEKKILGKVFNSLDISDDEFAKNLVDWASIIRKTFDEQAVDELISTRRLVHIAKAYSIFGEKETAIRMCINRFDEETKESFWDLYTKLDDGIIQADENGNQVSVNEGTEDAVDNGPAF